VQDRPTARELLDTIGDLLQGEVLDATTGPLKHQVRVAGNLCRILERELALQPDADRRAARRLAEVLESDEGDLEQLNRELVRRLRQAAPIEGGEEDGEKGEGIELERRAWPALLEIVRAKLAVNKPDHDSYDFAAETGEIDR